MKKDALDTSFKTLTSQPVVWVNTLKFTVLACLFGITAHFYILLSFIQLSIINLFMELGKESLQTRGNKHKPTKFYKIMHDLAPTYLSDLIPTIVGHSNNYALRNADHIQGFRSNSNLFSDSFFPSTIKAWNSLPNEVRKMTSVSAFRNYLNRNKLQSPYCFHVGSR